MDLLLAKAVEGILILKIEKSKYLYALVSQNEFFNGQYQYLVKTDSRLFVDSGTDESKKSQLYSLVKLLIYWLM